MAAASTVNRILPLVVFTAFQLADPAASFGQELPHEKPSSGYHFSLGSSLVSPFSLNTRSPILSPARIRTKSGYDIGMGMGYRFGDIRFEGKLIYGRFDADTIRFDEGGGALSGYFDLRGAMFDFFYDLPVGTRLRPNIGAGFGLVHFRARDVTLSGFPPTHGDNALLSRQLMAGVAYAAHPWRFFLGYRHMRMGAQDYETGGVPLRAEPLRTHALQANFDYAF